MGPTASGKTGLAEAVASELGAELISADAFQVYRGLDIGTAKPAAKERYRLLDIKNPDEPFGVGEWVKLATGHLEAAFADNRHVVVVGGTGLYIRALFDEYSGMSELPDPAFRERLNAAPIDELRKELIERDAGLAGRTDMANPVRVRRALERLDMPASEPIKLPAFRKAKLALIPPTDPLELRIVQRASQMLHNGWTREIEDLRLRGYKRDDPGLRAIGYRAFWDHLDRKIDLDEALTATIVETRRYAKRQRTWLRSEKGLVTLSATTEDDAIRKAMERIESFLM